MNVSDILAVQSMQNDENAIPSRPVAPKQGENAGTSALPQSNGEGSGPSILSNQIACLHVSKIIIIWDP